jgi:hypothetical protein
MRVPPAALKAGGGGRVATIIQVDRKKDAKPRNGMQEGMTDLSGV